MKFIKAGETADSNIFNKLDERKKSLIESGMDVINLSIGTPDFQPGKHVMEAVSRAALDPDMYKYSLNETRELLDFVEDWYKRRYDVELADDEIMAVCGSQEGIAHVGFAFAGPNDLILAPDPGYPIFSFGPMMTGSTVGLYPLYAEKNWQLDFNDIPEDVAERAKAIVVSYPNNPTAVMAPDSFYEELVAFAKKYDIIVLHDNAYSELVFDGKHCGSFLQFPGAREVGVEFNSLSKTYGLAGARIGFCVGNPEVVKHLKLLKSNMDYGMFLPLQKAAIAAITKDQSCVEATRAAYEKRRDVLCDGLNAIGWKIPKPEATMFVWAPIPENFTSSEAFAIELVKRSGVLVTPGSAFGPSGEGYVRMALVQDEPELKQGIAAIDACGILK